MFFLLYPVIFAVSFLFLLKVVYFRRYRRDIPGSEPELLFGSLRQMGLLSGGDIATGFRAFQKKYGDVHEWQLAFSKQVMFCTPQALQHILGTNRKNYEVSNDTIERFSMLFETGIICVTGARHKRLARVMLPMLKKHRVNPYLKDMTEHTDRLISRWQQMHKHNGGKLIHPTLIQDFSSLTLNIIGMVAFDYDANLIRMPGEEKLKDSTTELTLGEATAVLINLFADCVVTPIPPSISRILLKFNGRYNRARATIEAHCNRVIEAHLNKQNAEKKSNNAKTKSETANSSESESEEDGPVVKQNMLNLLLRSLQTDEAAEARKPEADREGITRQELIDALFVALFGGYETTATVLSWFAWYMSKHPAVQSTLKREIATVFPDRSEGLNVDDLARLPYCDAVVKELLRIVPMAPAVSRQALGDDVIEGVKIRKGEGIGCGCYAVAMDPRNWTVDPEQFRPDRFYDIETGAPGPDANHHFYAWAPFGGGSHACAGQDLARLELKATTVRLMQFVTFVDTPNNRGGYLQRLTILPKEETVEITFDQ